MHELIRERKEETEEIDRINQELKKMIQEENQQNF